MKSCPHVSPTRANGPAIDVDVVVRREPVQGPKARWQPWRRVLAEVLPTRELHWVDGADPLPGEPQAVPQIVSLSYHDARRWLDAQEKVERITAPAPVVEWLVDFVAEHLQRLEDKRRQRPASFQPLTDHFSPPARISAKKLRGPRPPRADS